MPDWIPRTADAANAAGAASASAGGTKRAPEPDRVGRRAVRRRRICTQAKFKPDAGRGRPKRRNAGLFGARGGGRDPLGAARPTVGFDLLARGQERATARGRTPRQRTGSERVVPPLRGASRSFCVDTILAERPVVPQRLRPKPSSLKRAAREFPQRAEWTPADEAVRDPEVGSCHHILDGRSAKPCG